MNEKCLGWVVLTSADLSTQHATIPCIQPGVRHFYCEPMLNLCWFNVGPAS